MEAIRQYLLSVVAAAIICGVTTNLLGKKGTFGAVLKLLTGLFLAITVVSPLTKIQLIDFYEYADNLSIESGALTQQGQTMANEELRAIIKSRTEAYILDKAASMGSDLRVEVKLSDSDPPQPASVTIEGAVSPYAKQRLKELIANELGIPEENQVWT